MRILYIEDNAANRALIERVQRAKQCSLIVCDEGEEALEILANDSEIDLILLDIELAGNMSGLDVIRTMRDRGDMRPVIALTAYATREDQDRILQEGCDHYISKPLEISELLNLLDQYDGTPSEKPQSRAKVHSAPYIPGKQPTGLGNLALIVDDEVTNRNFLMHLLELGGLHVIGASEGQEALDIANKHAAIDLLIIDQMLPDIEGVKLIKQLRERYPSACIVMATMIDERSLITRAFESGCNVYLVKPHGYMELYNRLQDSAPLDGLIIDQRGVHPYQM